MTSFTIEKTILIQAPVDVVFEALTNSSKIVQYYPLQEVISNWQVGGEIICKGVHDGKEFTDYGTIESLIENQQFQYTYWSDNHRTPRTPENHLKICYDLCESEQSKGTVIKVIHSNFPSERMYLQMLEAWDFLLQSLQKYIESNCS